jgi:hypothetical protein
MFDDEEFDKYDDRSDVKDLLLIGLPDSTNGVMSSTVGGYLTHPVLVRLIKIWMKIFLCSYLIFR